MNTQMFTCAAAADRIQDCSTKGNRIILHDAFCKTNTFNIPVAVKSCQVTAANACSYRPDQMCACVPTATEPGAQALLVLHLIPSEE